MRVFLSALSATLLFIFSIPLAAQVDPGPCDTCYKHFEYEGDLVIGGHAVEDVEHTDRRFPMSLFQEYGNVIADLGVSLRDSTPIRWLPDAAHPWGGKWILDSTAISAPISRGDSVKRIRIALTGRNHRAAIARGVSISILPHRTNGIFEESTVSEAYYVLPEGFNTRFLRDTVFIETADSSETDRRSWMTSLTGGFFWTWLVASTATSDTVKLGGRPRFVGEALNGGGTDIFETAGLPDSTRWMAVSVALRTDVEELRDPAKYPDTTVIAYFDIIVRNEVGDDACDCYYAEPWKRIEITKKWFLEKVDAVRKYRAFDDRLGDPFYDLDTLIDFDPIWNNIASPSTSCWVSTNPAWCEDSLASRIGATDERQLDSGTVLKYSTDNADLDIEVYSMTVVPLSLLRTRLASPHYMNLREGHYDGIVAEDINDLYADTLVDQLVSRIGPGDEPDTKSFRAFGMLSAKMQAIMDTHAIAKDRPKKLWVNPQTDYDAFRHFSGDFDSTRFRIVHTPTLQFYQIGGDDPIPCFYANPSKLGELTWDTTFRAGLTFETIDTILTIDTNSSPPDTTITYDTTHHELSDKPQRVVRVNNDFDYRQYNEWVQIDLLGTFRDRFGVRFGGATKAVAYIADIFKFKYRERFPNIPNSPVWFVVQTHGSLFKGSEQGIANLHTFNRNRTPTGEEIVVQAWAALGSGADGLIFGDMPLSGPATGLMTVHIKGDSLYDQLEYGMHRSTNQDKHPDANELFRVDDMWLGLKSRNAALDEVVADLLHIDSVIGWKNLLYNQEQMTVYDTLQSFDEIPMVRDLRTERAKRYVHHYNTGTGLWTFTGSDTIDDREDTFIDLTHFSIAENPGERAILVTNRRCWPIDTLEYDSLANVRFDALVQGAYSLTGLGAIDVRRPLVVLENGTSIIGDSVVVEKITPNGTWTTTAAFGDTVELDWLLPGRGALYRLTPTAGGLSEHSTAYNNAIHSENPSTDSTALDRLVVYERDSVVYLRSVDPNGVWSAELMLSDPDDTVLVNGKRTASNFFASLAIARDGTGSPRFVWERDSAGYRSVETAWINGIAPISRAMIDSTIAGEYDVERHRLIAPGSLEGPPALTPSIVAATDDNATPGFLVSWANHDEGVDLMAVRHIPFSATSLISTDTAGLYGLYATEYALKVGQYPTLATAMMQERLPIPPTDFVSGPMPTPADTVAGNVERADLTLAHMAWQQGDGVDGADELIYYRRVGTDFSDDQAQPTLAAVDTTEHVSKNIPGCSFEHPSIAADSLQVGVAFEAFGNIGASRVVTLRHRDTSVVDPATQTPLKAWETTYYRFGEVFGTSPFNVGYATGENVRPSLTHFPELDSISLLVQPEGALVWFWQDNEEGRGHPQYMYRYGWFTRRSLEEGAHPSLTLVPLAATNPFEQSSVLHRGDSAERVVGTNDEGTSVWYYSGNLLNTPGNPLPSLFNDPPSTGGIIAGISVFTKDPSLQAFCQSVHRGYEWGLGFDHPSTDHPDDDRHPPGDPGVITSSPGLPPTFFEPGLGGRTIVDTIDGAERISRTGLFAAGDESVDVIRYAAARDSISLWLDTQPFDTQRGVAANIWSVVELVRASDSVVLWRGDTLTARGLDTTTSPVNKILSVPVASWADSGEIVWIQVRGFATDGVDLSIAGGFTFFESFETQPSAKRGIGREVKATGSESSTLDLAVIPNPVTSDRAVLYVGNRGEGRITVTLWDNRGRLLRELPKIDGMRPGVYSVELDLEGLASGAYHLRAERGGEVTVESLTIP